MTNLIKLALMAVLVAWTVAGYAIWKWGPGLRKHWVNCPEKRGRARVLADQREAEFGSVQIADIRACSLLKPSAPDCSKQCRTHL